MDIVKEGNTVKLQESVVQVREQFSYDSVAAEIARTEDRIKKFEDTKAAELQALKDRLDILGRVKETF